jgi:hypothetical protein
MNHCFALAARMQPHKGGGSAEHGENHGKHGNHSAAHNIPAALLLLKILRARIRRKLNCHGTLLNRLRCFRLPEGFWRVLEKQLAFPSSSSGLDGGSRKRAEDCSNAIRGHWWRGFYRFQHRR